MTSDVYLHIRIEHNKDLPWPGKDAAKVIANIIENALWMRINHDAGENPQVVAEVTSAAISSGWRAS